MFVLKQEENGNENENKITNTKLYTKIAFTWTRLRTSHLYRESELIQQSSC